MITLIKPVGESAENMRTWLDRDFYRYEGTPALDFIVDEGQRIDVWIFDFVRFEQVVQEQMIKVAMAKYNLSEPAARTMMEHDIHAIPCAHVELVYEGTRQ